MPTPESKSTASKYIPKSLLLIYFLLSLGSLVDTAFLSQELIEASLIWFSVFVLSISLFYGLLVGTHSFILAHTILAASLLEWFGHVPVGFLLRILTISITAIGVFILYSGLELLLTVTLKKIFGSGVFHVEYIEGSAEGSESEGHEDASIGTSIDPIAEQILSEDELSEWNPNDE